MSILEFEFLIHVLTELNFVSTFVNYRQIQLGLEEISGNVHFVLKPWQVDLQRFKLTFYHTLDKNHFLVKNVTILVLLKVILLGMRRKYTKINQTDWVFGIDSQNGRASPGLLLALVAAQTGLGTRCDKVWYKVGQSLKQGVTKSGTRCDRVFGT